MQKTLTIMLAVIFTVGATQVLAQGDPTPGKDRQRTVPSGPPAANAG